MGQNRPKAGANEEIGYKQMEKESFDNLAFNFVEKKLTTIIDIIIVIKTWLSAFRFPISPNFPHPC